MIKKNKIIKIYHSIYINEFKDVKIQLHLVILITQHNNNKIITNHRAKY